MGAVYWPIDANCIQPIAPIPLKTQWVLRWQPCALSLPISGFQRHCRIPSTTKSYQFHLKISGLQFYSARTESGELLDPRCRIMQMVHHSSIYQISQAKRGVTYRTGVCWKRLHVWSSPSCCNGSSFWGEVTVLQIVDWLTRLQLSNIEQGWASPSKPSCKDTTMSTRLPATTSLP